MNEILILLKKIGFDENADHAHFVHFTNPWFFRGSDFVNGLYSGVFAFGTVYGHTYYDVSFRVVIYTIFYKVKFK